MSRTESYHKAPDGNSSSRRLVMTSAQPDLGDLNEHELTNHIRARAEEIGAHAALQEATDDWYQSEDSTSKQLGATR